MRIVTLILALLSFGKAAYGADPASVLGHAFGSLGCVELEDPDGRTTCEARALSNGKGCYGLSSQVMRDKCLDEGLFPASSRDIPKKVKKTNLVNPLPQTKQAYTEPTPSLSEDEIKKIEESLGLNNAKK
ncbi:hypothetical protein I9018_18385 [Pseudomonas sp. MPFS]|uniref:hypothetical protein n=1 Tax=Pseudomonas sp. MPFS TaxID=2795724 RepID=UPI001F146016|nr:hypothetical protein [Pseudomonas sp. MPFS]UMZ09505.1 hypothetical protein I9018_18385 [Pseudomonas sp. MPFS]